MKEEKPHGHEEEVSELQRRVLVNSEPSCGGGFFLACEDFGDKFDDLFPACTFFNLKWRSVGAQQCHFLDQDQSTVARRAETTVAVLPDKLRVSSFP